MTFHPALIVLGGSLIITLAVGIRQVFGLFLGPVTVDLALSRETFALAIAAQNLLWGVLQPFTGAFADRFGPGRVVAAGAAVYAAGLAVMAQASGPVALHLGAGILIGLGLAATGMAIALAAVSRGVSARHRSLALGIAAAGGSFGQFVMPPLSQGLIQTQGWAGALMSLAVLSLAMAPLAVLISGRGRSGAFLDGPESLAQALGEAWRHAGYRYLVTGFFVCGFQVTFVAIHLPAYLADLGFSPAAGATALAVIGFFNIIGTWGCGALGGRYSKKYLLSALYGLRAVVVAAFLVAPTTELSALLFAGAIGILWLGTAPLTSGLVAHIFGVRYMATLFGIVFMSHQVGSFLGVWLGGLVFDATGSYDLVWYATIMLGVAAALLHLPIAERPLRTAPSPAAE